MNFDFHYYATYLAARHALFSHEEGQTIAYAAQFVDDLTKWSKPKGAPPRVTCIDMKDMAPHFIETTMSPEYERELRDVWIPFHFIPGNENKSIPYQGKKEEYLPKWRWSSEEERNFALLCLPNSAFVEQMINDTRHYAGKPNFLHMIGLRMHVLADSWAHQRFLGLPAMYANDLYEKTHTRNPVQVRVNGKWEKINVCAIGTGKFHDDLSSLAFFCSPSAPANKNVTVLCHSRVGSLPDYGCLEFRYCPHWSDGGYIERDNRQIFASAFCQMIAPLPAVPSPKPCRFYPAPSTNSPGRAEESSESLLSSYEIGRAHV